MSTYNRVLLMGRLGQDPQLSSAQNGQPFCRLSLATDSYDSKSESKTRTHWHSVHVFGRQAEVAAQYLSKGRHVLIEGRMQSGVYGEGEERKWRNWIKADRVTFLSSKEGQDRMENAFKTDESPESPSDVKTEGDDILH